MTVTQRFELTEQTHKVVLDKGKKPSFGICIVRGEVKDSPTTKVSGIFIKDIVPQSPAHLCGKLKIGDRILRLNGKDVRNATEDVVIDLIKVAGQIISLDIQTFGQTESKSTSNGPTENGYISNSAQNTDKTSKTSATKPSGTTTSNTTTASSNKTSSSTAAAAAADDDDDEEDVRELAGRMYTEAGYEIDRASAGNVKRSKADIEGDSETEDEFGYTMKKIKKRWGQLGDIRRVEIKRPPNTDLGIALVGHKDRQKMASFIAGINPSGICAKADMKPGDELLEVNGNVIQSRCHLNVSVIFNNLPGEKLIFILLRSPKAEMSIKPVTHFPTAVDETEYLFSAYKNVKQIQVQKTGAAIGIMIIEGKHVEVGNGIFVSDLQAESPAEQAGIKVGDLILAINKDVMVDANYDTAVGCLKRAQGVITLILCSLKSEEQIKKEKEEEEKKKAAPPPEPEKPADPATAEIKPNKKTLIEVKIEKKPLGVIVVGGKNGFTTTGVVITHVYPDGAIGKDNRIQPFDQILEFNSNPLKANEMTVLKCHQTFHLPYEKVTMVVWRNDPLETETFTMDVMKKPGKDLGLSMTSNPKGACITEIQSAGCADIEGKLQRGDIISKLNGVSLEGATYEEIYGLFRQATGKMSFEILRAKPTARN